MEQHICLRIDSDTLALLDKVAENRGFSRSYLIRFFVRRGLQGILHRKRLLAELPVTGSPEQNPNGEN